MRANKRIRDLKRRPKTVYRLVIRGTIHVTTYPTRGFSGEFVIRKEFARSA